MLADLTDSLADLDDSPATLAGRAVGGLLLVAGLAVAVGGTGLSIGVGLATVGLVSVAWPAPVVAATRVVVDFLAWVLFEVVWRLVAGVVGALLDGV